MKTPEWMPLQPQTAQVYIQFAYSQHSRNWRERIREETEHREGGTNMQDPVDDWEDFGIYSEQSES